MLVCSQNAVEGFSSALCERVLTVRSSPSSVVEVPCVLSTVRRSRCLESVLPKSPRYIVGNPGAAPASGRLETETPPGSADPDRPALLDHIAECLVAMVRCPSDRQTRNCEYLASGRVSTVLALAIRSEERRVGKDGR